MNDSPDSHVRASAQEPKIGCEDCGLPYEQFPLDVSLPDADWQALKRPGDQGLLCAGCIVNRAAAMPSMIVVYARLVPDADHEAFGRLRNVSWSELDRLAAEARGRQQAERAIAAVKAYRAALDALKLVHMPPRSANPTLWKVYDDAKAQLLEVDYG